tara:strand:+ start:97 stop:924 length:828 start_codon:yes stop_codon:yes gene_type:complete
MTIDLIIDVDSLAARVPDGAKIALVKTTGGVPMDLVRALIRREVRGLHVVCVPTGGLAVDLLIGAGCVETLETSGVTLDEFGQAPAFGRAVRAGSLRLLDATCPAVYAGLQAGEKGLPFMPLRGLLGSDIAAHRADWKVIDNPFGDDDPIVCLPAIVPDFSLLHARQADGHGNLYVGDTREVLLMAHAARKTLATAERISDGNLLEDDAMRAGVIPNVYVSGLAEAEGGSRPLGIPGGYVVDGEHLTLYAEMARDEDGFGEYLDRFVFGRKAAAE